MREGTGTWLVIPTYNEADNLEAIVAAALQHLPSERRVLVVDDASPDRTGEIADQLADAHDEVDVLHRPAKEGLGPAYVAGFRRALNEGAELVAQMDADFSHDPADLPRLLEAAATADLVLGSRYVDGGAVVLEAALRVPMMRLRGR
jgi:glycosyltransferase involved in cell wall biosynthesis